MLQQSEVRLKPMDTDLKNLSHVPTEELHQLFLDAFSRYSLNMHMPLPDFEDMLTTRSFKPEYSTGLFLDDALIGMVLIGIRQLNGVKTAYNLTTGVSQEHQHAGLGSRVLGATLKRLQGKGCEHVILEVLDDNLSAKKMYQKHGFEKRRSLLCLKCTDVFPSIKAHTCVVIDDLESAVSLMNNAAFWCFEPAWQNAQRSYLNSRENHHLVGLKKHGEFVSYAIIHKRTGKIMHMGLKQAQNRAEVLAELMAHLQTKTCRQELYFINVDKASALKDDLMRIGFEQYAIQSEMIHTL